MEEYIYHDLPERTDKKVSWVLLIGYVFLSLCLTVWGGCLLLGYLIYFAFTRGSVRGLRNMNTKKTGSTL